MLVTGILEKDINMETANLINWILSIIGKKIVIVELKALVKLNFNEFKSYLDELEELNIDILLVKIQSDSLLNDKFEYLKFDIMIYDEVPDEDEISFNRFFQIGLNLLRDDGIVIVNVDDINLLNKLFNDKYNIVTFGFNSRANITTSSVGDTIFDDNFICCLQRTIFNKDGKIIEPQEYRIPIETGKADPYNILAAATFAIVNGIDLNVVNAI